MNGKKTPTMLQLADPWLREPGRLTPLSSTERVQLKRLRDQCGGVTVQLREWAVHNWAAFTSAVESICKIDNAPAARHVGFFVKFAYGAFRMMVMDHPELAHALKDEQLLDLANNAFTIECERWVPATVAPNTSPQ